jgi:hypothetical protein
LKESAVPNSRVDLSALRNELRDGLNNVQETLANLNNLQGKLQGNIAKLVSKAKDDLAKGDLARDELNNVQEAIINMNNLQGNLQENIANLVAKAKDDLAKGDSAKSFRDMASNVTDRVGTMVGDLAEKSPVAAAVAKDQVKSLATKTTNQFKSFGAGLESMAHKNRFGALAGAVLVGILIGVFGVKS